MIGKIGKMRGLAQIPLMIGLLIMAIAIPAATKLVQQSQENRSKAAGECTYNVMGILLGSTYNSNEGDHVTGVIRSGQLYQSSESGSQAYFCQSNGSWKTASEANTSDCRETGCPSGQSCFSDSGIWSCSESTSTCASNGNYCTGSDNNDPRAIGASGTCPSGEKCVKCAPDITCTTANQGQTVTAGGTINADGSGCNPMKICPATTPSCDSQGGGCIGNIPTCQAEGGVVIPGSCSSGVCCKVTTTAYTCASNGNYCTGSDNNDPRAIGASGTCPSGEKCVKCAPDITCTTANQGQTVTAGGTINADGSGCNPMKICPTVISTLTPVPTYTCASNGNYCTGSDNNDPFGIVAPGQCPSNQKCVTCKPLPKGNCITVGERVATGATKINADGSGCAKICTAADIVSSCNCPVGTAMAGQVKKPGDANCDGKITLDDFALWSDEFTKRAVTTKSNFGCASGRISVELDDFAIWRDNFKGDL